MSFSQEHKDAIAKTAIHNWQGGIEASNYALVLCPAGFVREHHVPYGEMVCKTGFGFRRNNFQLDFAHVEAKVDIELDGPGHKSSLAEDLARDTILREMGWRIIRIKHD